MPAAGGTPDSRLSVMDVSPRPWMCRRDQTLLESSVARRAHHDRIALFWSEFAQTGMDSGVMLRIYSAQWTSFVLFVDPGGS